MFEQKRNQQIEKINRKYSIDSICQIFSLGAKTIVSSRSLRLSLLCTLFVWTLWSVALGLPEALANLIFNWQVALTMVFGSMVAGGTSMGGGAVAFPVFTKVLHISTHEATVFSLAIQSVGMSAASLTIVAMGTKVEWQFIRWASLGGILGIIFGSFFLVPIFPPVAIKISFTMMITSFAVILLAVNRTRKGGNLTIASWSNKKRVFSLGIGVVGGIISALVGSGMDIVSFSVLVLLFGLCETVSTPTSVILMAINAVAGFILHQYWMRDFIEPVINYWLAAVPVVVVGAPTGAALCSLLQRQTITRLLVGLIAIELVSSALLIPLTTRLVFFSIFIFFLFSSVYYWMYHTSKKICN